MAGWRLSCIAVQSFCPGLMTTKSLHIYKTHTNLRTVGSCSPENDLIVSDILGISLSEMIYLSISTYDFKITQTYHGFFFISFKTVGSFLQDFFSEIVNPMHFSLRTHTDL